eukprot:TRINITY_DN23509_c0_g1_i2.p1 TRINITY_DN23509_c0_g1~~TRINITY_DN23509_c0_g1_i2.p1  ORF type:complete len:287 (+),score=51.70 TRINITY_DN23509_c0_g1_i2:114-974(+)
MIAVPTAARGVIAGSSIKSANRYGRQQDVESGEEEEGTELGQCASSAELAEPCKHAASQPAANSIVEQEIRAGFIRKVFGILAAQMTLTMFTCAIAMAVPAVRSFFVRMMAAPYANLMIFIPAICVLCALQANKDKHPTNYYLLWAFTALMSVSIAGICAVYQQAGLGYLILQAFGITAACFFGLSMYAFKSGKDFGWMGGILSMGLMGMIMCGFFGWLFGFSGGLLYPLFGVVLFCGYIVYDTHRVMREHGPDDAILASIELYLDILNLFLYVLEFLSRMNSNGD